MSFYALHPTIKVMKRVRFMAELNDILNYCEKKIFVQKMAKIKGADGVCTPPPPHPMKSFAIFAIIVLDVHKSHQKQSRTPFSPE